MPIVSVGGGLGSFAIVDTLRIAGHDTSSIAVLSDLAAPHGTYEHLAKNSQIPRDERLRSDSGSVLDCIWGWPGYAVREAIAARSAAPLWQVLSEPLLSDYYTPRAGQVYDSIEREAKRIGWAEMVRSGVVRTVRRRDGGGYFVLHTPRSDRGPGEAAARVAYRARFVHIAVGYPGLRLLPDLQHYRARHQDWSRVANAYEPHGHVYAECERRPCTIVVRGSGIVASRILQRIIDDRGRLGLETTIVHLFRSYPDAPQGTSATFRRPARKGWAYQAFNYPKASWGGQLRDRLERLEGQERVDLIDRMGGTNTAPRREWRRQLDRAESEGYYRQLAGTVADVQPAGDRGLHIDVDRRSGGRVRIEADFIVDATGLEAGIEEHRVLRDLLEHCGAGRNPKGRLDVDRNFRVRGSDSGIGQLYASGSITLGGYYAGVDSFLGLQYAALRICDALAAQGYGTKIGARRSLAQWWKWARNQPV